MTQATKTRKTVEIVASTVNRVTGKDGAFLGYAVKSNKTSDYYSVTFNAVRACYECDCAAYSKCCHIKAVEEVQAVRASQPKTAHEIWIENEIAETTAAARSMARHYATCDYCSGNHNSSFCEV